MEDQNMITVGVMDVKTNLSRYLACIKAGEDVLITERGKPIARIIFEGESLQSVRIALAPLIQRGSITMSGRRPDPDSLQPVKVPGKPISEIVIEDRR
jgi:antitoxin (DNA-binding transcriptional repressor) of toxin-antitoxin stability system